MIAREYTRVRNGVDRLRIRILTDGMGYAVVVTTVVPNPDYQHIWWRDKSAYPSHLYDQRIIECADMDTAQSTYLALCAMDRGTVWADRQHSEWAIRPPDWSEIEN